ncbi:MAG: HEAT repeat domain-containing protein [Candidatus Brocadiia bacterium]
MNETKLQSPLFLKISIILTALAVIGAGVYPVTTSRQQPVTAPTAQAPITPTQQISIISDDGCWAIPREDMHQKQKELALSLLTSQNRDERIEAINIFLIMNEKETIPEITKLLQDKDESVREAARAALKELGAEEDKSK